MENYIHIPHVWMALQFDSLQCRIYIPCSLSLRLLGFLRGSLGTYGLSHKLCLQNYITCLDGGNRLIGKVHCTGPRTFLHEGSLLDKEVCRLIRWSMVSALHATATFLSPFLSLFCRYCLVPYFCLILATFGQLLPIFCHISECYCPGASFLVPISNFM